MIDFNKFDVTELKYSNIKNIYLRYRVIKGNYPYISYKINNEIFVHTWKGSLEDLDKEIYEQYSKLFPLYNIRVVGINLDKK